MACSASASESICNDTSRPPWALSREAKLAGCGTSVQERPARISVPIRRVPRLTIRRRLRAMPRVASSSMRGRPMKFKCNCKV